MSDRLIVIGGGIAAQAVVEEVRERNSRLPITMISAEHCLPYDRVRLSELLVTGEGAESLQLRPPEWYEDRNVDLVLGSRVTSLDTSARSLTCDSGTNFDFSKVCLATGSDPLMPPINGLDKSGVFAFRDPGDCDGIRKVSAEAKHAAVIGGGLLGLEAARGVSSLECPVTVVHLMDRLMERQLDFGAAAMLSRAIESFDIDVLLRRSTVEALGDDAVTGLRFDDGEELECDLLVVSVGIKARTDLAESAGIDCDRGILVDDQMRASESHVFAVGECAQHKGVVYGLVAPIYEQAAVAANALLGHEGSSYEGSVMSTKLKVMGVDLVTVGDAEGERVVVAEDCGRGIYRKIILQNGIITGAILMGDTRGHELLLESVHQKDEVHDPLQKLADASQATVDELPDTAQICNCHGICKSTIVNSIREEGFTSTQEVVAATRAGAGCGSCKPLLGELVAMVTGLSGAEPAYLCPCRKLEREDIAAVIRENSLDAVSEVGDRCGAGHDCGTCKPALSYLISEINDNQHREERAARFINDRVHANIQKDGTFSVVPRIYGGVTSPDELRRIADVADKYRVRMVKITGGQRIDLLGVKKEQLPAIWDDLDMPSGHAYAKAIRTVKTCVGSEFCRFGLDDSIGTGIELEKLWEGLHTPHKVKSAVSGCPRNCAEASTKDIGLIAVEGAWQIRIGGAAGATVREGDVLATVEAKDEATNIATAFLQYYRENGEYLERIYDFVVRVGLETIKEAALSNESGEPTRLQERFRLAKAAIRDPWLERRDPVHHKQFAELDTEPGLARISPPVDAAGPPEETKLSGQ